MADVDLLLQFDDESFALQLQLQLEEIEAQRELQTGKWTENNPPDFALAFDVFEAELEKSSLLIKNLKVAHSIAEAVEADAVAIEEWTAAITQVVQDREFARSLNEDTSQVPSTIVTDSPQILYPSEASIDWDCVERATEAATSSIASGTTIAGPSSHYALRQRTVLDHFPLLKVQCSVCGESVHPHTTVRLVCNDIYCKPCLKSFFLRAAKDESLFPPKCHRQPIDFAIIEGDLSAEELATFRSAELEYTSTDRVYCAQPECSKFIPPEQRNRDHAFCELCSVTTCMHCKALAHDGGCPADEARKLLIQFSEEQGWKSCFGCAEMVYRYEGCDHMTCRCGTEFCYRCGMKWKQCLCGDWEPELLHQRAQQVVEREQIQPMAPAVRQQRVVDMERELQTNHECDHSGRFKRINGFGNSMGCEICGARHRKYILSCRRCHMLACEDCRRHRI